MTAKERWDIEATAPQTLARMGITPDTLKTGDKVTVGIRPLRDGRRGGVTALVVTADGAPHGPDFEALGLDLKALGPSFPSNQPTQSACTHGLHTL